MRDTRTCVPRIDAMERGEQRAHAIEDEHRDATKPPGDGPHTGVVSDIGSHVQKFLDFPPVDYR